MMVPGFFILARLRFHQSTRASSNKSLAIVCLSALTFLQTQLVSLFTSNLVIGRSEGKMISFTVGSALRTKDLPNNSHFIWAYPVRRASYPSIRAILTGSIVGTVTDPSGAVTPNSAITVTNTGTSQTRTDTTDGSGRFSVQNLATGTYSLTAITSGFRQYEQTNITVNPGALTRIDFQLEVGQASEKVNVSAQAVELQTDKADTHTEITGQAVQTMPLGGNRNYQTLINLTPGATPGIFVNSNTDVPAENLNTHINGGMGQTNITKIDGAESINVWLPQYTGYVAPAETIDVVNVTTSAGDADQGLAGSSAITVITKSGTNQLHGSAFIFHNDQHLNARNFFLAPDLDKPVGIYNNFGATLGGPIKKDKLFYFVSFDGTTKKSSANELDTVPTAHGTCRRFLILRN